MKHKINASSYIIVQFSNGFLQITAAYNGNKKMNAGGTIDGGEAPKAAAIRELQEESGIELSRSEVEQVVYIGNFNQSPNEFCPCHCFYVFLDRDLDLSLVKFDQSEIRSVELLSRADLLDLRNTNEQYPAQKQMFKCLFDNYLLLSKEGRDTPSFVPVNIYTYEKLANSDEGA